jgi:hypothetical protein
MIFVEPGLYVSALPGYCIAITGSVFFLTTICTYLPVTAQNVCEQGCITFQAPKVTAGDA